MKRAFAIVAAFAAVAFLTISAQAETSGEQIFRHKCTMCHMVKGKGGQYGPDLTRVSARLSDRAIREKLERPKKGNPASRMPSFRTLPAEDMDALMAHIRTLR